MEHSKTSMPVLFIGHGTPMNAIEDNPFSRKWKELGKTLPRPEAILCISAHWETGTSMVTAMDKPKTIHDFGGFPEELYRQQYPAPGSPVLADRIYSEKVVEIEKDYRWGLDHGTWSFLKHMYPDADIPVLQLSIDYAKDMQYHYDLGKELSFLRRAGVLIAGSGNMVHNLRLARPGGTEGYNHEFAYKWAEKLNDVMTEKILTGNHAPMINYLTLTPETHLGVPSEEHYIPLIYTLGLQEPSDKVEIFNDKIVAGSLSMTSLIISNHVNQ